MAIDITATWSLSGIAFTCSTYLFAGPDQACVAANIIIVAAARDIFAEYFIAPPPFFALPDNRNARFGPTVLQIEGDNAFKPGYGRINYRFDVGRDTPPLHDI
ncbi:hypothetical protein [Sneathiella sp.]|uniref:hypothetical protein n=1 Tax=Sneathiella sp. TaxID=1964365 RepID=UPI002FDFF28A